MSSLLHIVNIKNKIRFIEAERTRLDKLIDKYLVVETDDIIRKETLEYLKNKGYDRTTEEESFN